MGWGGAGWAGWGEWGPRHASHVALPAPSFICEGLRAAQWYLMGALCAGSAPTGNSAT